MSAVNDIDEWASKYSKLFIELDDGLELSFTGKRRFAKVCLLKEPTSVPPISELGPNALLEPMKVDEFNESLHKKKIAIKALLLDQSFISDIGNWIADELLCQSRIYRLQTASSLSKESWKKIDFITASGRTTACVPELQKLSGGQAVKAAGKPKRQMPNKKKGENDDEDEGEDDANEAGSGEEEEEATRKAKSQRELKPRGHVKTRPTKQKSKSSDDNDEENDNNPAAADEDNGLDDDDDDEKDQKKKPRLVTNDKQAKAKKESNKKVTNNSRKPKKKVK
ncbi:hypothetical protein P3X46_001242 [Hevea brasiliensis]|uniref:Formamidopyrimidine-DNA glycosylase H2TH DNA-binding domain-containing protein n=1 Tax=Hevea brasiliensis TaxID=3981 RepID=A0ABQ9NDI2_HEVBR|nr:hypothetical protein P3X46_001242 [Hevea brasiliensis]